MDSFVRELISILNSISIQRKSKHRFKFEEESIEVDGELHYVARLITEKTIIKDKERQKVTHTVLEQYGIETEEFTRQHVLDNFKESLIKAIAFYRDDMSEKRNIKSFKTLLSTGRRERKLNIKYENYLDLEVDPYYLDIEAQLGYE